MRRSSANLSRILAQHLSGKMKEEVPEGNKSLYIITILQIPYFYLMFSITSNRNGLGDDSYFTWPDGRIPFVIGDGFNSTNKQNILDAVDYYNDIFGDCIKWIPKSDEVKRG